MARNLGALFAGFVVVFFVVSVLQYGTSLMYPLPEGMDMLDPGFADEFAVHIANQPLSAWILAFASEILGVFLGALTAGMMAGSRKHVVAGFIVGLGQAGSLMNWVSFSHPWWFMIGQVICYVGIYFVVKGIVSEPSDGHA